MFGFINRVDTEVRVLTSDMKTALHNVKKFEKQRRVSS